ESASVTSTISRLFPMACGLGNFESLDVRTCGLWCGIPNSRSVPTAHGLSNLSAELE
ncbi:hypothetical protein AVEN_222414-1, partial [Araneus ventricosus]